MKLKLTKPLAVIDLETTGVNPGRDRIIEIAIVKANTDGSIVKKRKLINPGMPIPPESIEIHGITNEMVKDAPTFKQAANEIKQFLEGCDIAGFNSNKFDIPMLVEEFMRNGVEIKLNKSRLLDVQKIFHSMEPRNLVAAYKFYCNKDLQNAHSAEADAEATWEVLKAQVEKYEHLGESVDSILAALGEEEIVDFARRMVVENGTVVFNFGKHKGKSVEEVFRNERSYYDWMMQGDFPMDTKQKITEILHKMAFQKK